jgi:hypothetical protein
MKFKKKNEDGEMWGVYWDDKDKENFLCMTDHEGKANLILSVFTHVVDRSPQFASVLENVRDDV